MFIAEPTRANLEVSKKTVDQLNTWIRKINRYSTVRYIRFELNYFANGKVHYFHTTRVIKQIKSEQCILREKELFSLFEKFQFARKIDMVLVMHTYNKDVELISSSSHSNTIV